MSEKDMTVRDLYEALEPLLDEYGDLEVWVSYDSGVVATPIKNKLPQLIYPLRVEHPSIQFEGY